VVKCNDFGLDAFMTPVGTKAPLYRLCLVSKYGLWKDYRLGTTYETGSMVHAHVGYVIPGNQNTFSTLCFTTNDKSML
jgi:hypothetical protein